MSEILISLSGAMPPIPTPFNAAGDVDHLGLAENLERWNRYDLTGYVVLGSNGEGVFLTEREKVRVWETARTAIPEGKWLIAGTGCESTRETIQLTHLAAKAGADAALVVTPHYYGPSMTAESLIKHYRAVADASPIPVLVYNVPKFTNVNMDAASVARAASHTNIVGIKDTSGNITQIAEIVQQTGPEFQVLAGSASFFFAGLAVGAVGGIMALAIIAPELALDLYRLFNEGKWIEAAALQRRIIPINTAVTATFGIAGLKAALDMLGYHGGLVRPPLLDLADDERQALREILIEGGVLE